MISLSNEDFKKAVRLLKVLASSSGANIQEAEAGRKARLLLRKWERKKTAYKNVSPKR